MGRWLLILLVAWLPCLAGGAGFGLRVGDAAGGGAQVTAVVPGGPADRAGLRPGDVITAAAGQRVAGAAELAALLGVGQEGADVPLTVVRDGWRRELRLVPDTAALPDPGGAPVAGDGGCDSVGWLGIGLRDAGTGQGALVIRLPETSAARGHLRPGDLIVALDGRPVDTAQGFAETIARFPAGREIRLDILRDGRPMTVSPRLMSLPEAVCRYRMGRAALAEKRYQEAVVHFQVATSREPEYAPAWGSLAQALVRSERLEEAALALRRAGKLDPGNAGYAFLTGGVLSDLGREGEAMAYWRRAVELDPGGHFGDKARQALARLELRQGGENVAARRDRLRASVAVGDFQVKAAKATPEIGDGLREMLVTALHQSGYFTVVERMDIQGLAAEQALSRSAMAASSQAHPEGGMEVAEIMIYGVVSEFEPRAGGVSFGNYLPQMGMTVRQSTQFAEMAIDIRAVDVASGRVLVAQRIPGTAQAQSASMGANIAAGGVSLPVSLGGYRNTPMEQAIRDSTQKAVYFVINNIPQAYFRFRHR